MRRRPRRTEKGAAGVFVVAIGLILWVVGQKPPPEPARAPPPKAPPRPSAAPPADLLRVHFYDVSQGLAALVDLPGGAHVLVDTGDAPGREGCGQDCGMAHAHLMSALAKDLGGAPIDLLWITHQHSDHIGGARDVLSRFRVIDYVDNGRDAAKAEVEKTHEAALLHGTRVHRVEPGADELPVVLPGPARLTPIVPRAWPPACATNPNDCSIGLRIELGASSVLFTGDAEREEEAAIDWKPATLLQVPHHGSATSSSERFLERVSPTYAVVSAGKPGEGMNADYCLPRAATLGRLARVVGGGSADGGVMAYAGTGRCRAGQGWEAMTVGDHIWATERDGDVTLETRGDGAFVRR